MIELPKPIANQLRSQLPVIANVATRKKACVTKCGKCSGEGNCVSIDDRSESLLTLNGKVLPTLNSDGSRNWIVPSLARGILWQRRRWLAYGLIAFFVTLPHLRIEGKPYVLLDIARRQFTFVGHTFYPTDTPLVACLMLGVFFSVMLVTAIAGRVWCGWGCPQTVYLEFLFRPIDRFFANTIGRGGRTRKSLQPLAMVGKFIVYLVCCLFLAHTFLSYFVSTDTLARWIQSSPLKHPTAFLVMGGATAGMMFNFLYFREQFCMIACPYGRFQSVMLDRTSYIVAYDGLRGEPRRKGKRSDPRESTDSQRGGEVLTLDSMAVQSAGDCVDCGRCTAVCPTGIDIRNGLQMECIHCAQCIDACNQVMQTIGKPTGLIRYSTQNALAGKSTSVIRPRTIIYPTIILIALGLFLAVLSTKFSFDSRIMGAPGAPFSIGSDRLVQNNFQVRLVNRSQTDQVYSVAFADEEIVAKWSSGDSIQLTPGQSVLLPLDVHFPLHKTTGKGAIDAGLKITDSSQATQTIQVRLTGPK
jgi:cytochrome c oxidase accessory protein FixG